MQYDDTPVGHLNQRQALERQVRENTARLAKTYAWWTTTGRGEIRVDTVFEFGLTFIAEPTFLSGAALAYSSPDLVSGHYPRVNAGVYDWRLDTRGYYTGAWVYFVVDTVSPGSDPTVDEPVYVIHHHLAWEGQALKDLPAYLLDDV